MHVLLVKGFSSSKRIMASNYIPQWKKDLILRRRNQSKCQQLLPPTQQQSSDAIGGNTTTGQQPNSNSSSTRNSSSSVDRSICVSCVVTGGGNKCNACCCSSNNKMVQERPWIEKQHSYEYKDNSSDSDSSEDLHYGPGIVNKLKNRYLSLALRENNAKTRPSILPMRKATSLENLLDTEDGKPERLFEKRVNGSTENNRYRNPVRSADVMKRSRSIETISRNQNTVVSVITESRPKSLHEEMLIEKEGSDTWRNNQPHHDNNIVVEKKVFSRLNKPKRIAPVMNEREKPPADVVKQTKKLFEGRPEQRTRPPHATGEVAAKVATYKNIIVQTKVNKKPLIKAKPNQASLRKPAHAPPTSPVRLPTVKPMKLSGFNSPTNSLITSPIPDVSKTGEFDDDKQFTLKNSSLTETPDLILHSSPTIASPTFRIETTRKFLKEEINNYDKVDCNNKQQLAQTSDVEQPDGLLNKFISEESLKNIGKSGHSVTFNFSGKQTSHKDAQLSPLKVDIGDINNHHESSRKCPRILQTAENNEVVNQNSLRSESVIKSTNPLKPNLTVRELEKNLINSVKTLERPVNKATVSVSETVNEIHVPKVNKKPPKVDEHNSIVFKFTDRKDIPDYVGNDGRTRTEKITLPKVNCVCTCIHNYLLSPNRLCIYMCHISKHVHLSVPLFYFQHVLITGSSMALLLLFQYKWCDTEVPI